MARRVTLLIAAAAALALAAGCNAKCGDSCSSDGDCGGSDLVCYASQCAPTKCRENCSHVGVNMCAFNRVSCDYISCD